MIVACRGTCGRVRVDGRWGYWDVAAHEVGAICPDCLKRQKEDAEAKYRREFWAAQRRKAMGRCVARVEDPFDGLRS